MTLTELIAEGEYTDAVSRARGVRLYAVWDEATQDRVFITLLGTHIRTGQSAPVELAGLPHDDPAGGVGWPPATLQDAAAALGFTDWTPLIPFSMTRKEGR